MLFAISKKVWQFADIENWITAFVDNRLKDVPETRRIEPKLEIAGPLIQSLIFTENDSLLREMFASLLAAAMDSGTVGRAHPAYIDVIKHLTNDEALLLKFLARQYPEMDFPVITIRHTTIGTHGYIVKRTGFSDIFAKAGCKNCDLGGLYLNNLSRLGILDLPPGVSLDVPEEASRLISLAKNEFKEPDESTGTRLECKQHAVLFTDFGKTFIGTCVLPQGSHGFSYDV